MSTKPLPDIHGCYSLLGAVVRQARADAKRSDPSALEFLRIINAPVNVESRRRRVISNKRKRVKA